MMDTPAASMRDLARRLLAVEAARQSAADPPGQDAARVFWRLRVSLVRFAGADGFASLLRRAVALARAEFPALRVVKTNVDGSLEGIEQLVANADSSAGEAAVAVTAHLLGLLVTFIGEPLTVRLVREAWPDASLD
jgi:hypothetical protein